MKITIIVNDIDYESIEDIANVIALTIEKVRELKLQKEGYNNDEFK